MQSKSGWWAVEVEDKVTGIQAIHYQYALYPSTAREAEETAGYIVREVRPW